ncbi:hypothetical protein D3C80_1169330 [compost metagenome]
MQDRQALGHDRAQVFQFFGADAVLAAVEQQGHGHVEALQGLGDAFRQQGQQHEMPRAWRRAQVHVVLEAQQALLDERLQPLIDHRIQFVQRPANEQLRLQVGIQRAGVAQDLFATHARGALEEARQQRRQREDVQYVVAVVGHQDGVLFVQIENLAQGIALLGQQVHVLHMLDQRPAIAFRQGGVWRIGDLA